jgi:hypothetical protein
MKTLNSYALAAIAAGVSTLALNQPAESEVIIKNTNIPISRDGTSLDLNGDGITDIKFNVFFTQGHYDIFTVLDVQPSPGNAVVQAKLHTGYASDLVRGALIGTNSPFGTSNGKSMLMEEGNCSSGKCHVEGSWVGNHPNRFVGIKFLINGETHYGWARLTVKFTYRTEVLSATLTEYGYETLANTSLEAGVPSTQVTNEHRFSLGWLAAGFKADEVAKKEE